MGGWAGAPLWAASQKQHVEIVHSLLLSVHGLLLPSGVQVDLVKTGRGGSLVWKPKGATQAAWFTAYEG